MSKFIRRNYKKILILYLSSILFFNFINFPTFASESDLPDFVPFTFNAPDSPWVAGEEIEIIFEIKNIGNKNVSIYEELVVGLYLDSDQTPIVSNSTFKGLEIGKTCFVNISWTPQIADGKEHTLKIFINYNQKIEELIYTNNYWYFKVVFKEEDTSLKIKSIDISENLIVGKTANISATIINNGKDTKKAIYAKLNTSQGEIQTLNKVDGLKKDETYIFNFIWTPSKFGTHIISVDLLLVNKTHDYKEINANVGVAQLDWWDNNWHYRYFLTVKGSGNVSYAMNFTKLLGELDVFLKKFENNTIRIISYSNSGLVIDEVEFYNFDESIEDKTSGNLLWKVPENPNEKYYCIYFDVDINPGNRISIEEDKDMKKSGNAIVTTGFVDGWHIIIQKPVDNGYTLIHDSINISVLTESKAKEVNAFLYLKKNVTINSTIELNDIDDQINWSYQDYTFIKDGNWIIQVSSLDKAGYIPNIVEHNILVGNPDLEVIDMTIFTESKSSEGIYKNTTITVNSSIISHKATIEDVSILFTIKEKSSNKEIYSEKLSMILKKDKIFNLSFNWFANISGIFNIYIIIDPDNEINESNEKNNKKKEEIKIHEWPDLVVKNIILPSETIMEFEQVKIDVIVENKGKGSAINYKIILYIEEYTDGLGIMKFIDEKDNITINLSSGENKKISMLWDSAEAGKWLVGVNIPIESGQRDLNILNNQLLSEKNLIINSYERNKPEISIVFVEPEDQQQGGIITIFAEITDDSGLQSVKIKYIDPLNVTYNWTNMIRQQNNLFKAIFDKTLLNGNYKFEIKATDISIHSNIRIYKDNFVIYKDKTKPIISFLEANPRVQLKDKSVEINCIVIDNIDINTVKVTIIHPGGGEYQKILTYSPEGKYVYKNIYNKTGRYIYEIEVKDKAGNIETLDSKFFWITKDLDDTDNDGMPNEWEEKNDFDPENPNDGLDDFDKDGIINKKEYELGTNPLKDIFSENAVARLKDNVFYLVGSIIAFLFISIISLFGKRRGFN